jgi:hypothetical protein
MTLKANFTKRTAIIMALTVGQSLAMSPLAVLAADGSVRIAGNTVFENKVSSGGMSVDQRAESIQKNLDNALVAAKDRSPSSVGIVYVKGVPVITLGGYQVCTVDADNARLSGVTPAVLAQRWADSLKKALGDTAGVNSYVAQLTGAYMPAPAPTVDTSNAGPATNVDYAPAAQPSYGAPNYAGAQQPTPAAYGGDQFNRGTSYPAPGGYGAPGAGAYGAPPQGGYPAPGGYGGAPMQGRVVYVPAGMMLNATLNTSIATQAAQPGDLIQATLSGPVQVGAGSLPPGTVLIGSVTEAKHGGFLGRAGTLGVKFNRLRTPDGIETPITAHIEGGIGKYQDKNGNDTFKGETWKTKVGAALGTGVGAIAGGGRGAGRGAWSGTAIGAGVGVLDSLVLRKGKDVVIPSGQQVNVQLDAPANLSIGGGAPYTGAF